MSNYQKWRNNEDAPNGGLVCVLIVSRNKDNKNVPGWKDRRISFLAHRGSHRITDEFTHFCNNAVLGETCRLYISVNDRDPVLIKYNLVKALTEDILRERLPQQPRTIDPAHIASCVCGIAARPECAASKHWLLDVDTTNKDLLESLRNDLFDHKIEFTSQRTPNGYAFITETGFDTRWLNADPKYKDIVTVKRDDLLCTKWYIKKLDFKNTHLVLV